MEIYPFHKVMKLLLVNAADDGDGMDVDDAESLAELHWSEARQGVCRPSICSY